MAEACLKPEAAWFALTVKAQHEKAVEAYLRANALEGYAPRYRAQRRWSDRIKTVERPLFPGYVFCRFSFMERLKVLGAPGVGSIVGFGGVPAIVQESEINAMKAAIASGLPIAPW